MKSRNYRHVLAYFYSTPFALLPGKLAEIESVLARRVRGENVQVEQIPKPVASGPRSVDSERGYSLVGGVAVIPITGTITPRPSLFEEYSGGTSHEAIGRATDEAVADGKVSSILYEIDSPGGVVFGMPEGADKVYTAQQKKPTTGIANFVAASAAYWYLSQCKEAVCSPSGQVGCIGVLMANTDATKALEMAGIRSDLVSNDTSPFKSEGYPQVPVTAEALADMKGQCNALAAVFANAVAKGRGASREKVEKDFGKGRMLLANDALAAGMINRVDTMDGTITRLARPSGRSARREIAAQMVRMRLPTA